MAHTHFKMIREKMGLSYTEWAVELGYGHKPNSATLVRNYETGKKAVPPWTARLAYLIYEHWCAEERHLPDWPEWLKQEEPNERCGDGRASKDQMVPARAGTATRRYRAPQQKG